LTPYAKSGIFISEIERASQEPNLCRRLSPHFVRIPGAGTAPRWVCDVSGADWQQAPGCETLERFSCGILEVVSDHFGDTFRTVYTVRLQKAVYVLHAFQKKAKHGIATPKSEIDLVKQRLRRAIEIDQQEEV
jgi:phage-related protein